MHLAILFQISSAANLLMKVVFQAYIYLFKVSNKKNRQRCKICSMLTIKKPERRQLIVNVEIIPHLFLMFLLLTLKRQMLAGLGNIASETEYGITQL